MTTTEKTALSEYLQSLGLSYQATFQPIPQPKETVKYPQLHWLITLTKDHRTMHATYRQGMAHVVGYKPYHKTSYDKRLAEEGYRRTCETGKLERMSDERNFYTRPLGPTTQPEPRIEDVLYCLVSDADVLNTASYEEWASTYGYDEDSRKGEAMYRDCLKQSLALKNIIGFAALEKLRELYQDY